MGIRPIGALAMASALALLPGLPASRARSSRPAYVRIYGVRRGRDPGGSEKGKLRGTLIDMDDDGGGLARVCTFTAKRTSTAIPVVSYC
jgi:hypothetical protein